MKIRKGKHSRWCRHLQREFGSKQIAELIVFTGKISPEFLHKFSEDGPVAETQSAELAREKRERKMRAVKARHMLKFGKYLEKALRQGRFSADDMTDEEHRILEKYASGELQAICNEATRQHGHGKIVLSAGDVMNIGGSTGGKARRLLDGDEDD